MALPYTTASTYSWGSFVLTPNSGNSNGIAYIAEDFETTEGSTITERRTELGAPNGAIMTGEARSGRGTLQLAATTTIAPALGDEFIRMLSPNTSNITFFFTEVSLPKTQRDFHTVKVAFREKV